VGGRYATMINAAELDQLNHAIVSLGRSFRTVLDIAPNLFDPDPACSQEELSEEDHAALQQPRMKLLREIRLAYKRGDASLIDRILSPESFHNSVGPDAEVPENFLKFVTPKSSSLPPLKDEIPRRQDGQPLYKQRRTQKMWPPPLPEFSNKRLENQVFTHKSVANEKYYLSKTQLLDHHNERVEFMGDAVLNFIMSNLVYKWFPDASEGDLTAMRSLLVCNDTLWDWGTMYGLEKRLQTRFDILAESEGKKSKVIADTMEAYIGGLYMDPAQGPEAVREWITDLVKPMINDMNKERESTEPIDKQAKQQLYVQVGSHDMVPEYVTVIEGDNLTPFTVECRMGDDIIGVGTAGNIKNAGIRAAMMARKNKKAIEKYSELRRKSQKTAATEANNAEPTTSTSSTASSKRVNTTPANSGPKDQLYSLVGSADYRPVYSTIHANGSFHSKVSMCSEILGMGGGRTKKEAEHAAATEALQNEPLLYKWVQQKKRAG
jgi:ribonuclease-3